MRFPLSSTKGFTLIESLVGVVVFVIITVSVYQAYATTMGTIRASRLKVIAAALSNEQFEIIRNLPYDDVGVVAGIPNGKVPRVQNLIRDGTEFSVETTIRNVDDPFDGTIGGSPNDLSPADYRLAELEISCSSCRDFPPLRFTTYVGPRALEAASTNGSLFVRAFDAVGQSVAGASVHIENNQAVPPIIIDDTTNNEGFLQIVDTLPGVEAYAITVSKSGYSADQTHQAGAPGNPNPTKPHATVVLQQLTQISFAIDKTSMLGISSVTETCNPVPAIDFSLSSSKLIGTSPDVPKYSASHTTDGAGQKMVSNLEWDTYNFKLADETYDLAGAMPLLPLTLNPNINQELKLVVATKTPDSLLVTVKDASDQSPLSGVTVRLLGASYDTTLITPSASSCIPPGQVFFTGLNAGDYILTVSKTGYQPFTDTVTVSLPWQAREVILSP